ncbi:creatininase family protein [Sinomonas sp. JGH33]|uniref:Creatininase family protein n=1 Tax=Sinomonas terricola TaxID=3110330 RepID=A0ABU5T6E2_9MICC|nr:creatininase family protein [Sinomonas sp. JGH33]MEA5455224.1 creatininase family protein [Sinomonas sp. JGH33]
MEDLDAFTHRERLASGNRLVTVPVGSVEQHGPHLPLTADVLLARAMSGRLAEAVGGLVAAPIVYGYKSQQRSGGPKGHIGNALANLERRVAHWTECAFRAVKRHTRSGSPESTQGGGSGHRNENPQNRHERHHRPYGVPPASAALHPADPRCRWAPP